ncbi:hypothetical protein DM01DRAFT_1138274 [Hesseltinella vesiculosa]|uniref:Uncharacterized protein n=1 Tax=Hesseltinella vesiculosa TaxID=101127 RepID=A0A1X2G8L7_9FUNG|nr:hypothetical protein DM01DRAFT_1138274 [Hesseltinella vesiculosa]
MSMLLPFLDDAIILLAQKMTRKGGQHPRNKKPYFLVLHHTSKKKKKTSVKLTRSFPFFPIFKKRGLDVKKESNEKEQKAQVAQTSPRARGWGIKEDNGHWRSLHLFVLTQAIICHLVSSRGQKAVCLESTVAIYIRVCSLTKR